jgi:hypothetical protein
MELSTPSSLSFGMSSKSLAVLFEVDVTSRVDAEMTKGLWNSVSVDLLWQRRVHARPLEPKGRASNEWVNDQGGMQLGMS